ncbi:cupin domain-containing protein [Cyclobacterium sp. 1_MG-2023]|uniref:cupin domain-containing protein n=1 Tax=Cyclobacterium sp. 1_MG-2023 TaxID=3062681 RepID=UPI0026E3E8BA|nr:cupin domain-containing protein [Cyclobacterium sp. 1_MG-2023]MDO6437780.1 cupin domain-containing protein [Cyclobacterium sp. 1_MG-2023]
MKKSIVNIIDTLGLVAHPEGGFYKETYRSHGEINENSLPDNYKGKRNYSTCIYFLLTSNNFSAFHRINQDEIWHFYDGSPIRLHTLSATGVHEEHIIGKDIFNGQVPQFIVPGGFWFAAEVIHKDSYSLVGCTVSPGFNFNDFELIKRETLVTFFPKHKKLIARLTHM